jgi:VWFA-related protein
MKTASFFVLLCICMPAFLMPRHNSQRDPGITALSDAAPILNAGQGPPAAKKADQAPPARGQTQISVSVDLVNLQVLVTDKKGNIITGLKDENFTLYEDNVKQEITHFAPVDAGITVVLLVDFSKMVEWFIEDVWNAIYGFAESLRKGDWVAVIGYDLYPTILTDFTQNRNELYEALSRLNTPAFRESNLSDAVIYTLDRVEEIEGKVAVLLVSTGFDTFSKHTYDEALKKCKSANASVYAIGVGQSVRLRYNLDDIEFLMADNRLRSFAEFTGGEFFSPRFPTEFPSIFKNISSMLRNQYSLAYASSNPKRDGKFRKIRVMVTADINNDGKPDELKILTRSGYQAREK